MQDTAESEHKSQSSSARLNILVVGGTGLVGSNFVKQAHDSIYVDKITVLCRRQCSLFQDLDKVELLVEADIGKWDQVIMDQPKFDVVFSSLGVSKNEAASWKGQRLIDCDLNLKVAQSVKQQGTGCFIIVTSFNNPFISAIFPYFHTKLSVEEALIALEFDSLVVMRPGPLVGERKTSLRQSPSFASLLSSIVAQLTYDSPVSPLFGTPVKATQVAEAAVYFMETGRFHPPLRYVHSSEMLGLSRALEAL